MRPTVFNPLFILRLAVAGATLGAATVIAQNTTRARARSGSQVLDVSINHQPPAQQLPPTAPDGLSVLARRGAELDLAWNASTPSAGRSIARYEILRNGTWFGETLEPQATVTYDPAGVMIEYFSVRAVDDRDRVSAVSQEVQAPRDAGLILGGIRAQFKQAIGTATKNGFLALVNRAKIYRTADFVSTASSHGFYDLQPMDFDSSLVYHASFALSTGKWTRTATGNYRDAVAGVTGIYRMALPPNDARVELLGASGTRIGSLFTPVGTTNPWVALGTPTSPLTDTYGNSHQEGTITSATWGDSYYRIDHRELTLSDEYTDTDLRNQADAYWQTAVGKLPDLGWGQGANASEAGLFTNSLTDSAVSYLAGRAYIGANGVANTLQLTNSVYRLRVARNEQPQRLRWAEVFYPADGSAPQAVQVREVIMPASSSESYTQEFTIAPPQSAGGVKLEPAGSGLAVSLPIQASDGSGPRLYVANALFTNQTADMNVNLVNTAGTTSVIVTTTGSSVTLIAIDPNVDFHQGRAAALADGQVIASGTDLWSLPNRPGVGGWSLVAVGAQSGTTAISFAVTTFGATQTHSYTLSVYPLIELAVDANRDGLIKLASEDGSDATSSSNPFRFWLNEGEDGPGSEAEETAEPGSFGSKHDYQHDRINYKRDLEDWTRLKLRLPASLVVYMAAQSPSEATGGLTINLEWNTATLQQATIPIPGLKFVAAVDGSKDYLKDVVAAERQITGIQGKIIGSVDASSVKYMLPGSLFKTNPNGVLEADLLFEGMAPGRGQLVLSIFRDGQRLVEANPINIEIRPMQEFYEHWTANTADTDKPDAVNPVFPEALHPEGSHPAPFAFKPTDAGLSLPNDPEGNEYILFVHGFRMKPYERRVFAETAAKRLYQLGYRGKFGFFSWPTEWVNYDVWLDKLVNALADPDIYDRCEATARASGSGPLANLLIGLRSRFGANHVHIFAHSMGNVVVSEALRALLQKSDGPNAAQYVACQSAEVASAYDPTVFTGNSSASPLLGGPDRYTYSPDLVRASTESGLKSGDNYHKGVASRAGVMTNFFNGTDSALSTWKINQDLKPDNSIWLGDTTFSYDSVEDVSANPARFRDRYQENPPGLTKPNQRHELHWEAVPDRYRILAFIIEARSKAVGATAGVKGEFQGVEVDLDGKDYAFDKIHSAEFLGDPIVARKFYQKLLTTFDLKQYETE